MTQDEAMAIMNKYHSDALYTIRGLFQQCRTKADTIIMEQVLEAVIAGLGRQRRQADIPEEHPNYGGPSKLSETVTG